MCFECKSDGKLKTQNAHKLTKMANPRDSQATAGSRLANSQTTWGTRGEERGRLRLRLGMVYSDVDERTPPPKKKEAGWLGVGQAGVGAIHMSRFLFRKT